MAGSIALTPPPYAGQHEPAADHRRLDDDVRVRDPPGDRPVGLDGERLQLGLQEHVPEPR